MMARGGHAMPEHILITGGAGFIGANFVRHVLRERPGARVTNLDALTYAGNLENLADVADDPRYRFVKGDIADADAVARALEGVDAIVHLAAETHVDRSIMDARPFVRTNVLGTHVLLEAARRIHVAGAPLRFVHVSTDEVYGSLPLDPQAGRFTESSALRPNNPYAASKAGADLLAQSYHRTFGLPVMIARCSNNFGPYQFPEKIIPLFVTNLLEGRHLPLYGDGRHVRDWLHVEDHCDALLRILESGRPGEAYNIGADNEHSNLALTREILRVLGKGEEWIRRVPDRPAHDERYSMDSTRIMRELGWRPTRSAWPASLERTVEWYVSHADWWRRVRAGEYTDYYQRRYGELEK